MQGQLRLDRDDLPGALDAFRRAVRAAPFELEARHQLATTLRLLRRDAEAAEAERENQRLKQDLNRLSAVTKELIGQPGNVAKRYEAGILCLRLGHEHRGVQWLLSALLLDSDHEPTRQALLDNLPKLGDPALAERYRRLLEARPKK